MKKSNIKILLAGLTGAFVVSACAGSMLISASAENTDPVNSLALEYGASVRYVVGDTSKTGIRFSLKMKDSDYLAMTGEGSAYSDVTFGVLIAPEYYHDIYAFNYDNVFGANAKYYLNDAEGEGKEKIYNLTGSLAEMKTGEAGYVYFNASLIDILGVDDTDAANNIALDFRGVGYVKYTLNSETVYKFVDDDGVISDTNEYDNDNVRSMATVADAAIEANTAEIAKLDKEGKTEDDQATIDFLTTQNTTLQASYINKVNYTLASRTYSETIDPLTTTTITVPTSVWALKDTYLAKKYTLSWTFAGSEVTAGQVIDMPTLSGTYDLIATATNTTDDTDSQVVYTKTYTVNVPNINDKAVFTYGNFTYDVSTGVYATAVNNTTQYLVDTVTDGDYVVEATITGLAKNDYGYMPGLVINAGGAERIAFKSLSGAANLWINVSDSDGKVSECYVTNFGAGIGAVGETMKMKVAKFNDTYYVYNANNAFMFALDAQGIHPNGNCTVGFDNNNCNTSTMNTFIAKFFANGKANIVGAFTSSYSGTAAYSYDIKMTKDAEASYAIGNATVNGLAMTGTGTATYVGNGVWKNADKATASRQYYLNTVVKNNADFVLETNIEVESKARFGGWTGVSLGFAKTTRSDKTLDGVQARVDFKINNYDIALDGGMLTIYCHRSDGLNMAVTVKGFNANIGASGGMSKMTLVKLANKMYVYDNSDKLVCTMDANGVYGATESNVVAYKDQNQAWYQSNIGYSIFNGATEFVAGMLYEAYGAEDYGIYKTALALTRGTTAANNKVNPTA